MIPIPNLSLGFGSSYGPGGSNYGGNATFGNVNAASPNADLPSGFWDKPAVSMPVGDAMKYIAYAAAAFGIVFVLKALRHKS